MTREGKLTIIDSKRHKKIWIYGIGVMGKRICQIFNYFEIKIEGIFVSSMKGNIDNYRGISVREFDACSLSNDDLIIVTATGRAKDEICSNLISKGYEHILWTPDLLTELWKSCEYKFINRKKNKNKLCLVLSGYKDFLWGNIYERSDKYSPEDVEIWL